MPANGATLLLPESRWFSGQSMPPGLARALARADRLPDDGPGERLQLLRQFEVLPRGWPIAALTRQADAGDAAGSAWLRADPCWVRPDINGARLLAHGDALQLTQDDVDAFLPALRPVFGDAGFTLDAPLPARWYLRLPREAKLPMFAEPAEALGADIFDYLPGADASTEGRRWRTLLSDVQVMLHNHPWNARRSAAGKAPVNSLWFWGGGTLPDHVATPYRTVVSDDAVLRALSAAANVPPDALPLRFALASGPQLIDQRDARDLAALHENWLQPALLALGRGTLARLRLDCADGIGYALTRGQRWRFWRRPLPTFGTAPAQRSAA